MHLPEILQARFADALCSLTENADKYAGMIRGTNDPKFGDYQSNCAMPLAKQIDGKNPREIATEVVAKLQLDDICETPEIAGAGFVNLKLKDSFVIASLVTMLEDKERCLVATSSTPKNIVIDFSSPNVAKPMHVGHIRSTVIGDCLAKVISFLGHNVVTDNHLGDWGTQFGTIIYGYKHFGDPEVVENDPVPELTKLYRKVQALIEYHKSVQSISDLTESIDVAKRNVAAAKAALDSVDQTDKKAAKKAKSDVEKSAQRLSKAESTLESAQQKISEFEAVPGNLSIAKEHSDVGSKVLIETAKLHEGDEQNLGLWEKFLPHCKDEINRVYKRLNVEFDHVLGESFYHPMLAGVVDDLKERGMASDSEGAICVFVDEFDAPMIVQKKDGAFLYSTTDLATLTYRMQEFQPHEILYVVDTRQSEHFEKLFAVAKKIGIADVKLEHVNFGTVLGEDGKPMKTRSGTLIGLEGLLDDAVAGAREVVCDPSRLENIVPPMDAAEQDSIAETIGISAIKYADLAHHRTSDYRFNLKKMVELKGNTATYIQYAYARTQSIFRKSEISESKLLELTTSEELVFTEPEERALALELLKLEEALAATYGECTPNQLVDYVYSTAKAYSKFNDSKNCRVLESPSRSIQTTRLLLVVLSGRVLKLGLSLLGIQVVDRM